MYPKVYLFTKIIFDCIFNPPEMAEIQLLDGLVERRSTNPKVVGSNPTPVEIFGLDSPLPGVILTSDYTFEGG